MHFYKTVLLEMQFVKKSISATIHSREVLSMWKTALCFSTLLSSTLSPVPLKKKHTHKYKREKKYSELMIFFIQ